MPANMLAMSDVKAEVLWFSSKHKKDCNRALQTDVRVGDVVVKPSSSARNLGVIFDSSGSAQARDLSVRRNLRELMSVHRSDNDSWFE